MVELTHIFYITSRLAVGSPADKCILYSLRILYRRRKGQKGILKDRYDKQLEDARKWRKDGFKAVKTVATGSSKSVWYDCNPPGCTKVIPA